MSHAFKASTGSATPAPDLHPRAMNDITALILANDPFQNTEECSFDDGYATECALEAVAMAAAPDLKEE